MQYHVLSPKTLPSKNKKTEGNADSLPAFNCTSGRSCGAGARRRRNEKHKLVSIGTLQNIGAATKGTHPVSKYVLFTAWRVLCTELVLSNRDVHLRWWGRNYGSCVVVSPEITTMAITLTRRHGLWPLVRLRRTGDDFPQIEIKWGPQ